MRKFALLLLVVVCAAGAVAERVDTVSQQKAAIGRYILAKERQATLAAMGQFSPGEIRELEEMAARAGDSRPLDEYIELDKLLGKYGGRQPWGSMHNVIEEPTHAAWFVFKKRYSAEKKFSLLDGKPEQQQILVCEYELNNLGKYAAGVIAE